MSASDDRVLPEGGAAAPTDEDDLCPPMSYEEVVAMGRRMEEAPAIIADLQARLSTLQAQHARQSNILQYIWDALDNDDYTEATLKVNEWQRSLPATPPESPLFNPILEPEQS